MKALLKFIKIFPDIYYLLRNDAESRASLRILILGIVCCLFVGYGGKSVFLDPQQKSLQKNLAELAQFEAPRDDVTMMLTGAISKFEREQEEIGKKIAVLNLKENYLKQHWDSLADPEQFTRIILTLLPGAPVDIRENVGEMRSVAPQTLNGFELCPVTLSGDTEFRNIFTYLQYLEKRPEIGVVDKLEIKRLPIEKNELQARIHFSLLAGRLTLRKTI
ncbi:MAG: hypothetical protein KAR13_05165 [Desulfobulbaceae bacterium]|nr:hypothetical protein [Desulfobulbaceae bacterium]MCK5544923.1 hypothetical protein [Desulfobulbaceae bacterium]